MSTTQIFNSYMEFYNREDKNINGVSQDFANDNPSWEDENKDNKGCWNCSDCSGCSVCSDCSDCSGCSVCSDCSDCSDCSGCSVCSDCSDCSGCSVCSDCSDCSDCSGCSGCSVCSDCSDCSDCSGCSGKTNITVAPGQPAYTFIGGFKVPIIENIHQKVYESVCVPDAFDMGEWHTCDTTHCRAGWVEVLAGEEGKVLARQTSTEFAAMQIYKASSSIRVFPPRFYESNEVAMADIKRCAEEEAALINNKN